MDPTVSANQLSVEEEENDQVRVRNLSTRVTVRLADGSLISPGAELARGYRARIHVGDNTLIEIESVDRGGAAADGLLLRTIEAPIGAASMGGTPAPRLTAAPVPVDLARWFESLVAVQRSAASSRDFFAETARAVVELIGLDWGMVLLRTEREWKHEASIPPRTIPKLSTAT